MTALRDLVHEACLAPADDGPRERIVDALGEPDELARFMRAQLDRTRDDRRHGRRRPTVSRREDELGVAAMRRWLGICPELAGLETRPGGLGLVRGMIGRASVTWGDLGRAVEWWRFAPIQHLDVQGERGAEDVGRLVTLPLGPHLESLSLRGCALDDADAAVLAGADLRALRWLDLTENRIGRAGAAALVASRSMPRLVIADTSYNLVDPREVALYEKDLGTDAVWHSRHGRRPPDEFGNTWSDYVQDTTMTHSAAEIAREHRRPPWARVLWRSRREIPDRECVWPGLADTDLGGEDLRGASFLAADLERVRAVASRWRGANLAASRVDECDLSGADLTWVYLAYGAVRNTRLVETTLTTSSFRLARVMDCDLSRSDLTDVSFEGAEVVDSSFHGARLTCGARGADAGRTRSARFVRCDFRGADFAGRELSDTRFIDCAFAGAVGVPVFKGPVEVERPDFSVAGDRSDVRSGDELLALWGHPSERR